MPDEKLCPNCAKAMQAGSEGFVPITAGFREIKFPVEIYECPQCRLVQLYAADRRL
jgi:Zn-finger nucleic acid-binding protein